jgi:hypothetical protein
MTSHPSLSQEKHAIDGLLLLQRDNHSAHPPSLFQSEAPITNASPLVTPPKCHDSNNGNVSEGHYDLASILRETTLLKTSITNPYCKPKHPIVVNPYYRKSTQFTLTMAQKERIARNKATALKLQRMNNQPKQKESTNLLHNSEQALRSKYNFTLSQEEDLCRSFVADEEINQRCSFCGLSSSEVKNPYKVMAGLCRKNGRVCDNSAYML